ncbi:aldo/keto reductase [Allopontixanthobacter sediminis]|uniref:Aldo/keto reductase n=1 Tax=Allopontixanthobacter sediminis TaxID=1689985 RepID=A0A845B1P3_9SPHN|nr:aldo/keto reductase [Allopontixanthobacter sediminis]MXP43562.1 aldo/keto reductase [Allopontixanthobacter sediminis]
MTNLPSPPRLRPLGKSGIEVSGLAWGMWRFAGTPDEGLRLIEAALDSGINFFDTADIYGFNGTDGFGDAETLLGRILSANPSLRGKMVLASKGGIIPPRPYDSSAGYLTAAIDASLARLGTDVLDLWQVHRPDILTHPHELAETLHRAVKAGKVRALGVSNYTLPQIKALQSFLDLPLASTQPEISPLCLAPVENGELDMAMQHNLTVMAWSPLGGGRIADPGSAREHAVAAALDTVAEAQGATRTAAAYSWLMAHPAGIIPIVGTQNPGRIAEAAAAYDITWTRNDWYDVLVASRGENLP